MADQQPSGWVQTTLGTLGTFSTSSVDKKLDASEVPVQLVNYMDVYRDNFIDARGRLMQTTASRSEIARSRIAVGDILFTPSSETPDDIGHSAVISEPLHDTLHSYHTVRLRPNSSFSLDLRFSGWFANASSVLAYFSKRATGSTRYTLTLSDFSDAPVAFPAILAEQRQIAEILDTLEEAIRRTEQLIAKLKRAKQGLVDDLLARGLGDDGELREPRRHPERFKESSLGSVPAEWEVATIGSLCRRVTYGFTNPMPTTLDGPFMLTAADIGFGQVLWSQVRQTSDAAFSRLTEKSRPDVGDILVTKDGTLGRVALLDRPDVCVNQSVAVLKPRREVLARYLAIYLLSVNGQRRLLADAGGSAIGHIYISRLAQMQVPTPPDAEAGRLAEIAHEAEKRVHEEAAFADKLRLLKRGLMEDLLTGRVRVTPLLQGDAK
jgi:type I restriction enzyme S subunit